MNGPSRLVRVLAELRDIETPMLVSDMPDLPEFLISGSDMERSWLRIGYSIPRATDGFGLSTTILGGITGYIKNDCSY
jgi:hypothetical protein